MNEEINELKNEIENLKSDVHNLQDELDEERIQSESHWNEYIRQCDETERLEKIIEDMQK
jgi:uncharacterized protein YlxW (UPF0749 family)